MILKYGIFENGCWCLSYGIVCEKNKIFYLVMIFSHYPFPKRQIVDTSNLKGFTGNNSKFDKMAKKFSKRVENTEVKGEIAHYKQCLLFPQCFQKACTADT